MTELCCNASSPSPYRSNATSSLTSFSRNSRASMFVSGKFFECPASPLRKRLETLTITTVDFLLLYHCQNLTYSVGNIIVPFSCRYKQSNELTSGFVAYHQTLLHHYRQHVEQVVQTRTLSLKE